MLLIANLLLVVFGIPCLLTAVTGKATRGENMMGFHLVVFPIALGVAAATGLGAAGLPDPLPWPIWLHYATLPGLAIAVTVLIFGSYGGRSARKAKAATVLLLAGIVLLLNGHWIAPVLTEVGSGVVLVPGALGTLAPLGLWLRARMWRIVARIRNLVPFLRRRKEPSSFEVGQMKFHRDAWQRLPSDAGFADVLSFTRSFADDVKAASLARLEALPDLDGSLIAHLATPRALEAMFYVRHQYPRSRAPLAAALTTLLDAQRADFEAKARNASPPLWTGDILPLLECGIAVLRDGGDVRPALQRWHATLGAIPDTQRLAKELARLLKKSR